MRRQPGLWSPAHPHPEDEQGCTGVGRRAHRASSIEKHPLGFGWFSWRKGGREVPRDPISLRATRDPQITSMGHAQLPKLLPLENKLHGSSSPINSIKHHRNYEKQEQLSKHQPRELEQTRKRKPRS